MTCKYQQNSWVMSDANNTQIPAQPLTGLGPSQSNPIQDQSTSLCTEGSPKLTLTPNLCVSIWGVHTVAGLRQSQFLLVDLGNYWQYLPSSHNVLFGRYIICSHKEGHRSITWMVTQTKQNSVSLGYGSNFPTG